MRTQQISTFAHQAMLLRYMKDINISPELCESLCNHLCHFINQFIKNMLCENNRTDDFTTSIKQLGLEIDNENLGHCLQATKAYLKSRDFHCPRKYHSTSWFWGQVKYVTESHFLQPLYECIDDTIETLSTSQEMYTDNLSSFAESIYQLFKLSCQYAMQHPYQVLVMGLCISAAVASGKNSENNNASQRDQCSWPDELFVLKASFAPPLPTCSFAEGIPYLYHVIQQNVPLENVRYFVLLEAHNNLLHDVLKRPFISNMGNGDDFVLLESIQAFNFIPCESLHVNEDFETNFERGFNLGIDNGHICVGWDNTEITEKIYNVLPDSYLTINRYFERINDNIKSVKQTLTENISYWRQLIYRTQWLNDDTTREVMMKLISIYSDMKVINNKLKPNMSKFQLQKLDKYELFNKNLDFTSMINMLKEIMSQVGSVSDSILNNINMFYSNKGKQLLIKERNKSLISTLETLSTSQHLINTADKNGNIRTTSMQRKFFVFAGAEHAVPNRVLERKTDWSEIHPDDMQHELRQALHDKPYAILYPK